jgi:F-type H+-transporting ATPase subunit c
MKTMNMLLMTLVVATLFVAPAFAQEEAAPAAPAVAPAEVNWAKGLGAGFGAAITILGAGYGISTIAAKAVESMARQPEVAGNIQGAMIVSAALIEGVSFFALIVCILIVFSG